MIARDDRLYVATKIQDIHSVCVLYIHLHINIYTICTNVRNIWICDEKKTPIFKNEWRSREEISKWSECTMCVWCVIASYFCLSSLLFLFSFFLPFQNDFKMCWVCVCVYFFVQCIAWPLIWISCLSFSIILMWVFFFSSFFCVCAPTWKRKGSKNPSARNNIIPEPHTDAHIHKSSFCRRACEIIMMITGQMIYTFMYKKKVPCTKR